MGQSPATIGVAFAVYPIALFVFSPPAGWLCSKIGQAPVLYAGVLLEGVLSIPSAYFATLAPTDALRVALYIFLRTLQVRPTRSGWIKRSMQGISVHSSARKQASLSCWAIECVIESSLNC